MDSITISTSLMARFLGLKQDELLGRIKNEDSDELNENYESELQAIFGDRLSAIKEEHRNRGIREKAVSIEKPLKELFTEYGINSDRAEDGIKELTEKLKSNGGQGSTEPDKLTLDQIKSLPLAQQWVQSEVQALKDAKAEKEQAFTTLQSEFHNYKVGGAAKSKALEILTNANAIGATPDGVNLFLKALGTSNINVSNEGEIQVLDSNGEPLKDNLHNPVTFEQYVKDNWKFGFSEKPAGSGSPNYKPGQSSNGGKIRFTDEKHYEEQLKNAGTDLKKKSEIRRAWAAQLSEQEKQ